MEPAWGHISHTSGRIFCLEISTYNLSGCTSGPSGPEQGRALYATESMDQYRSRLKLSENFERHWSILISGEIHMDQSLVHTFSWGNSYGPTGLKVLLKFPPTLVLVDGWLFPAEDSGTEGCPALPLILQRDMQSIRSCLGHPQGRFSADVLRVGSP